MKSLLTEASLILLPNGYKEGKLYSTVPSNGAGDFTVARATTATRVNSAGLVELVPYNLLTYSQTFSNVIWLKIQATISSNIATAPNGTNTASKLVENTANDGHHIYQNALANGVNTFSFYAKKGERTFVYAYADSVGQGKCFNLTSGTLGVNIIAAPLNATIESVGNDWFRCTITLSIASASALRIGLCSADGTFSYLGNGTSGAFIWGAQLNQGTSALDYQRTETRLNIPRLDYSLGSCPSILVEPQRTNLALRSEEFENATIWTNTIGGTGANPIRTANAVTSPSGIQNADTIVFDRGAGNTITDQSVISQQITIATTGTYYFSVWIKATASGDVGKQVFIRCGNAAALQAVTLTANWVRYETTATVTSGSNSFQVGNRGAITNANSVSVDLWGAQLEAGAYATSYIPTTSATVTRNSDVMSLSNVYTNNLITASGGTWFVELRNNVQLVADNSVSNIWLGTSSGGPFSNGTFMLRQGGGNQRTNIWKYTGGVATSLFETTSNTSKISIKWNGTTADIFVNGVKVVDSTSFNFTVMEFLNAFGGRNLFINSMALFPTPLTDDQLELLTGDSFNTYAEMASYYNYTLQ